MRDVTTVINDESTVTNQCSSEASQGDKRSSEYFQLTPATAEARNKRQRERKPHPLTPTLHYSSSVWPLMNEGRKTQRGKEEENSSSLLFMWIQAHTWSCSSDVRLSVWITAPLFEWWFNNERADYYMARSTKSMQPLRSLPTGSIQALFWSFWSYHIIFLCTWSRPACRGNPDVQNSQYLGALYGILVVGAKVNI